MRKICEICHKLDGCELNSFCDGCALKGDVCNFLNKHSGKASWTICNSCKTLLSNDELLLPRQHEIIISKYHFNQDSLPKNIF